MSAYPALQAGMRYDHGDEERFMDVGVLTTLGSAVGVILSLLGAMAHLRREIRGDIRGDIREVRSEIRILDERLRDLQVDMGIVKYCLGSTATPPLRRHQPHRPPSQALS